MQEIFERRLIVVTGKGGVGKTTVAAALGLLAAESGRRTLVVEFGAQARLPLLFGAPSPPLGEQARLSERLSSVSIDPDRALLEWIQALGGRVSGRVLASSGTFQYFAAAAPGAREIVSMVKIWKLAGGRPGRNRRGEHDLVILDAPATGHALGLLRSPETFGKIARVGPIVRDTAHVRELLADPARSAYLAVAQGTEMAVTETIELQQGLREAVDRELEAVVVNGLLPRRFSAAEMSSIEAMIGVDGHPAARRDAALAGAAARAAREVHGRASFQRGQVTRLRRRGFAVLPVPFLWQGELDVDALQTVAARLRQGIEREPHR